MNCPAGARGLAAAVGEGRPATEAQCKAVGAEAPVGMGTGVAEAMVAEAGRGSSCQLHMQAPHML